MAIGLVASLGFEFIGGDDDRAFWFRQTDKELKLGFAGPRLTNWQGGKFEPLHPGAPSKAASGKSLLRRALARLISCLRRRWHNSGVGPGD